jgi:hypothetical protein
MRWRRLTRRELVLVLIALVVVAYSLTGGLEPNPRH